MKINIGFQKGIAALKALVPKNLGERQTTARSIQSNSLNYNSVATLDPSRLAAAFMQADQGFITEQAKLFELVEERDPHIYSQLNKRRLAVTGLKWQLQPPRDASQSELDRTAELTDMITGIDNIEDAQFDLTDAIGKGLVALEINWKPGDTWLPEKLEFVPQRHFQTDLNTGALLYLSMGIPEPLRSYGWIVHEHRAKSGYIEQAALFRVLAWTYAYKAYNIKDMQRFLEVYGLPLRLGKYPAGTMKEQRAELLKAVRNIGNDGAGIIPANMMIDFVQATKTGTVDDFLNATQYWENKQSAAILGGDLDGKTTTEARITLYDKVRGEIKLHDVKQLEPTYSKGLLKPICLINGLFAADRLPTWKFDTEEAVDQKQMADVLDIAINKLGLEIDKDYGHKLLQIPRAKDGADLLGALAKNKAPAALRAALSKIPLNQQQTIADAYARQLTGLAVPYEQALVEQIAALVTEAGSFEDAMTAIADLTLKPSAPAYIKLLQDGMTAANLAGRAEVK